MPETDNSWNTFAPHLTLATSLKQLLKSHTPKIALQCYKHTQKMGIRKNEWMCIYSCFFLIQELVPMATLWAIVFPWLRDMSGWITQQLVYTYPSPGISLRVSPIAASCCFKDTKLWSWPLLCASLLAARLLLCAARSSLLRAIAYSGSVGGTTLMTQH